jgi:hypothetical protein
VLGGAYLFEGRLFLVSLEAVSEVDGSTGRFRVERRSAEEGSDVPEKVDSIGRVAVTELSDLSFDSLGLLFRVEGDFSSKLSSRGGLVVEPFFGLKYISMFADLVGFCLGVAGHFWAITTSFELRLSRLRALLKSKGERKVLSKI